MNNIRINKYFYLVLICVLFIGAHFVLASETFQNNLIKMEFYQNSSGAIGVKLFTSKPYTDSVSVNKKSDFEYVILMPETANSLTKWPSLKSVLGIVTGFNIKTQQYEDQAKGYTKITVLTSKPVNLSPSVQTLSTGDHQLSENDYNELLAQAAKKNRSPIKKEIRHQISAKKAVAKPVVAKKQKSLPEKIKTPSVVQKTVQKIVPEKKHAVQTKLAVHPKEALKPRAAETTKTVVNSKTVEKPKVVETQAPIQQQVVTPQVAQNNASTPVVDQNAQPKVQPTQSSPPQTVAKVSAPVGHLVRFQKYKNIIKNNLYIALGLLALIFILLLLGARKMTKGDRRQKMTFASNLDEKPDSTTNYMEKISEDMTWKEKYQTYMDAATPAAESSTSQFETSTSQAHQELDELFAGEAVAGSVPVENMEEKGFGEEMKNEQTQEKFEQYLSVDGNILEESEIPINEISQEEEILGMDKLNELFGGDEVLSADESQSFEFEEDQTLTDYENPSYYAPAEEEEAEEEFEGEEFEIYEPNEPEQSAEIVKSEFAIDDNKGFYLVDYENSTALVGHIEDEIFVLKQFKEKVEGNLQARLNERTDKSVNYMTKIGNFKALVEVTPNKMNLLIEL